jgi:hypothetical protein
MASSRAPGANLSGRIVARAGEEESLPPAARQLLTREGLRRVALALDDAPEHAPHPDTTGGAHLFFALAERWVLTFGAVGDAAERLRSAGRVTVRQVLSHMDAVRRERRKSFLGYRLIARVADKTHIMSSEVRSHLELLCDLLMDLEDEVASGGDTTGSFRLFVEKLDELIAWPKGSSENFQANLESLRASLEDLRPQELTVDHLRALIGGLELTIQSWVLP